MLTPQEQLRIIRKGVHILVNEDELLAKLTRSCNENKPLVAKLGLDPSAPDIHLGHAVVLRKMKQIQDLGHTIVIVIGDFTGKIGDPSGKAKGRTPLSEEQVKENAKTYCEQIFKILDPKKTQVRFNSEWLAKLTLEEVLRIASSTTVARILERDDFENRYKKQLPIGIDEFFYPIMQAYDSIALHADIELGGTDQTFNILMGRTLQKAMGQEEQVAMFMPILEGLDGIEKMSKSLGNYIGIHEPAEVMFKKVMEIPDNLIIKYFELATDEHPDTIAEIQQKLENGENPKHSKYLLAQIITALYHGKEEMEQAKKYYDTAFTKKEIPDQIPELLIELDQETILAVIPQLIAMHFISSKNEFLRLINQGGIQLNGKKLSIEELDHVIMNDEIMKIGKKKFLKFVK